MRLTAKQRRKIALYLKYLAFLIDEDAKEAISPPRTKVPIKERQRRISEGLKLAHAAKKKEKKR